MHIQVPETDEPWQYSLRKDRLREVRRREGRYLLRTNLVGRDPAQMWEFYTQLVQVEEAFKTLKGDLTIRPIFHQKEDRIEAHIFMAFMVYALHVTLRRWLRDSWGPESYSRNSGASAPTTPVFSIFGTVSSRCPSARSLDAQSP